MLYSIVHVIDIHSKTMEKTKNRNPDRVVIPKWLNKTIVAHRYYLITHPDRGYEERKALMQFVQDRNIDPDVVRKVVTDLYSDFIMNWRK